MTVENKEITDACSFTTVKNWNRKLLFDALDKKERSKALVWDQGLTKPFFLVSSFNDLKAHGVTQMFPLQNGPAPLSPVEHVIYICQPSLAKMELVVDNLRNVSKTDLRQFHLIFVPRSSVFCQSKLKEADVLHKFSTVTELPIFCYSWDVDVLSMQDSGLFRECVIDADLSGLYNIVLALLQLEDLFGPFSQCYFKGEWSEYIYRMFKKKHVESQSDKADQPNRLSIIDRLVLIDRTVDLVTPLVTQLTYEGLIDELFGIKCTQCKFPKEKFSNKDQATESQQEKQPSTSSGAGGSGDASTIDIVLNSNEELFGDLRNLNFSAVGPALSRNIKAISELQDQRHKATTVREYKEFVKRMPQLQASKQSASTHMSIAEMIKENTTEENFIERVSCEQEILNLIDIDRIIPFVEESISKGVNLLTVLRLICIQCLVSDGLKAKVFDQYRKEFLQAFGYQHVSLLVNLHKAGFLKAYSPKTGKGTDTPYSTIKKSFHLVKEDVNEQNPNDLSYVYSGYAPLSARLCQFFVKPGWKSIVENLKRLPGSIGWDENLRQPNGVSQSNVIRSDSQKITLVVFVGGVTFAEISALRYLSETDECRAFCIQAINFSCLQRTLQTGIPF